MTLLLIGIGALALVLPGLRPWLSLRGDPHWFVPLDLISLVLGVSAVAAGLALSVAVGFMHLAAGSSLLTYEGHLAPGGLAGSLVSAALLGMLSSRFIRAGRHAGRGQRDARAETWLGQHHDRGDHELVILPTSAPVAYSVKGSPPQVVISRGLQDRLETDLMEFVIDHERAHLRGRHRHCLVLAACTEASFAWAEAVKRSTLALRLAVERAADEEAAGRDALRRRHIAAAMRRLGDVSWAPLGGRESARYRAGRLGSPLESQRASVELAATAGLAALALVATVLIGHATTDLPALVAGLQ